MNTEAYDKAERNFSEEWNAAKHAHAMRKADRILANSERLLRNYGGGSKQDAMIYGTGYGQVFWGHPANHLYNIYVDEAMTPWQHHRLRFRVKRKPGKLMKYLQANGGLK